MARVVRRLLAVSAIALGLVLAAAPRPAAAQAGRAAQAKAAADAKAKADADAAKAAADAKAKADGTAKPKADDDDGPRKPPSIPRRRAPDYAGRPAPPATLGERLAWIPRVALFPLRVVVDYVIRRPLGWLVTKAEHSKGFRKFVRYIFREVKEANPLIYPVALVDFGFKSSVGIRALWRDGGLVPYSTVGIKLGTGVGTGAADWWRADATIKSTFGPIFVTGAVGANRRPDYVFYGVGSDTPPEAKARYGARRIAARASIGGHFPGIGELEVWGGVTDMSFRTSTFGGNPSIEQQVIDGLIDELPAGYVDGFETARFGAEITLDTRTDGRRARSGARLDASIERVIDRDDTSRTWTRLELIVGSGLLLDPVAERKLDIKLGLQFIEHDADVDVPFVELAQLTGSRWLRGMPTGRLYGDSAAAFLLDYHWPVAAWLDAHAHLGVGNVFDRGLRGFSLGALRGSAGGALTIAGLSEERQVGVSAAYGTEPLGDGLDFSSYRVIVEYAGDY